MVVEEVTITLSGGAPWGFRLQGGTEHKKPLQVAKVRKRSKACRAGLREADELVSINDSSCGGLSHAEAMDLIDSSSGTLHMRVKRAPAGFQSVVLLTRAPSPRIDKEYRASTRAKSPKPPQGAVREVHREPGGEERVRWECVTSPQGSEAYYGETDSDADVVHEKHRRQKRRSPSSTPARPPGRASPEETSEMSGYDSAPDVRACRPNPKHNATDVTPSSPGSRPGGGVPGVARKEVIYQPPRAEWSSQTEVSTENSSVSTDDQNPRNGTVEVDSGFQEPHSLPPLVSPEGAREALQLASRKQLVPMVGPVDNPVDEELTVTYMDKAKEAKLHRGDTAQDKNVKEARTKCRTIASLLTDAPNPHSKGVLMFKKRRQRSKKYTLTSFGSVDEEARQDSHEDDGVLPGSESEFDEDGFTAAPDPTWDSDYMETLEKRSLSGREDSQSPGLTATSGKGARLFEQQRKRAEEHVKKMAAQQLEKPTPPQPALQEAEAPIILTPTPLAPPSFSITETEPVLVSTASVVIPLASKAPQPTIAPPPPAAPASSTFAAPPPLQVVHLPTSTVVNRTARPFAPGFISHRASTAPVVFRPNISKATRALVTADAAPPPFSTLPSEVNPAAGTLSPCTAARAASLSVFSPTSSVADEPFSPPLTPATSVPPAPTSSGVGSQLQAVSSRRAPIPAVVEAASVGVRYPTVVANGAPASAEQGSTTPASRTGILMEARRRANKKPMFNLPEEKKGAAPNPELLSLVQNLDERPKASHEPGFESGPEEDFFNLGAEACDFTHGQKHKVPPPVAPKPRVVPQIPQIPQMGGKGAELFARRQSRMDRYMVDSTGQQFTEYPRAPSPTPSLPAHWKYSSNIRAPPPIGYNPLLSPSCPPGAQRSKVSEAQRPAQWGASHKGGIRAVDVMRRQPYQLNPAMFSFTGASSQHRGHQSHTQQTGTHVVGSSLTMPRQIPVKSARVYEIRRFSTPTPMSVPTTLAPTVIAPRAATTLGDPLPTSDSPPLTTTQQRPITSPSPPPAPTGTLPELPKISSFSVPGRIHVSAPVPYPGPTYTCLQASKVFLSAPDLSPLRPSTIQVPKPRFVASKKVAQASVWKPGYVHP